MGFLEKLFGNYSKKEIKRIIPLQEKVLSLEEEYKKLTDAELKAKTAEFKERLLAMETLDDILPEAFATCREASARVLGMRHFPVQILGGIVLHQGRISEMKTGEGKTLVATLPAYLNALSGKGVHIVTVNDYLAKRDSEWMGKLYGFLGLTVGLIIHGMNHNEKKPPMMPILPTAPIMNLVLIIFVIIWQSIKSNAFSVSIILPLWMRLTPF